MQRMAVSLDGRVEQQPPFSPDRANGVPGARPFFHRKTETDEAERFRKNPELAVAKAFQGKRWTLFGPSKAKYLGGEKKSDLFIGVEKEEDAAAVRRALEENGVKFVEKEEQRDEKGKEGAILLRIAVVPEIRATLMDGMTPLAHTDTERRCLEAIGRQ